MFRVAITKNVLQEYLNKLPISYYLGEKLETQVSESGATCIDLSSRTIFVSLDIFNNISLDKEPSEKELEDLVRNALYHEVSHAMLTPPQLKIVCNNTIDFDLINIFEDQRIETILNNYYNRVDFPKFVKLVNNYKPNEMPNSAKELFYQLVRYGEINKDIKKFINYKIESEEKEWYLPNYAEHKGNYLIEQVDYLIKNYKGLNSFSHFKETQYYAQSINRLYHDCERLFEDYIAYNESKKEKLNDDATSYENKKQEEKQEEKKQEEKQKEKNEPIKMNVDVDDDKEEKKQEEEKEEIIIIAPPKEEEKEEQEENEDEESGFGGRGLSDNLTGVENFKNSLSKELALSNNKFYEKLRFIIKMYKCKQSNNSGSCVAYNGRLDARTFVRDNNETYKWFIHSNGNQLKKGCKLHLNIFCDTSGSFSRNETTVNSMLKELEKVEKEMSDIFDFDIFEVDQSMRKMPKNHRRISCDGGTYLTPEWNKVIMKAQDPNNDTINISLFDGEIYTRDTKPVLKIFNKDNFINIIESSNAQGFKQYCKQARKNIIINTSWYYSDDYTKSLEENILKVLHSYVQGR